MTEPILSTNAKSSTLDYTIPTRDFPTKLELSMTINIFGIIFPAIWTPVMFSAFRWVPPRI
jgi:hypothetical protein